MYGKVCTLHNGGFKDIVMPQGKHVRTFSIGHVDDDVINLQIQNSYFLSLL